MICNLHFIFVVNTCDAVVPLVPKLAKHTVSAQLLAGDVEDEDEGDVGEDVDGDNDDECNKDGDDGEGYFMRKMVMTMTLMKMLLCSSGLVASVMNILTRIVMLSMMEKMIAIMMVVMMTIMMMTNVQIRSGGSEASVQADKSTDSSEVLRNISEEFVLDIVQWITSTNCDIFSILESQTILL